MPSLQNVKRLFGLSHNTKGPFGAAALGCAVLVLVGLSVQPNQRSPRRVCIEIRHSLQALEDDLRQAQERSNPDSAAINDSDSQQALVDALLSSPELMATRGQSSPGLPC
jgi:uncharacterized membrane protein YccC